MGQTASSHDPKKEISTVLDVRAGTMPMVPTGVDIGRASVASDFWTLQRERKIPTAVLLESYGKEYAALFAKHCGGFKVELKKCRMSSTAAGKRGLFMKCRVVHESGDGAARERLAGRDRRCCWPEDSRNKNKRASSVVVVVHILIEVRTRNIAVTVPSKIPRHNYSKLNIYPQVLPSTITICSTWASGIRRAASSTNAKRPARRS